MHMAIIVYILLWFTPGTSLAMCVNPSIELVTSV
jgi:hypothetical protein